MLQVFQRPASVHCARARARSLALCAVRRFIPPLNGYVLGIANATIFEEQLKVFESQPGASNIRDRILASSLVKHIPKPALQLDRLKAPQQSGEHLTLGGDIKSIKHIIMDALQFTQSDDDGLLLSPRLTSQAELDEFHASVVELCSTIGWLLQPVA